MSFVEEGNLLFKNKKYEEAIEKYTEAISNNEDLVRAYSNRAQCNLNLKNYEKTLEDSDKVLEIEPEHVKSHLRRIKAKECLGSKNDAIKAIFEIMEKMPNESNFKQALQTYDVVDLEQTFTYMAKVVENSFHSTKYLESLEEKDFHDTWHVVDYFDATKDKKFDIPIPPHLFAPIFEDKQKVLQYYTKFVMGFNPIESCSNVAYVSALHKLSKKTLVFKSKIVKSFGLIHGYPKCKTVNYYEVAKGGKLVKDFESHYWVVFQFEDDEEMYVDFQAARYSFFDQLSDGSFVKVFSPSTSENYRVEKDSKLMNKECKEWIDKKYLKESKNSSQVFYHLESMMEKVVRELILKEKKFL